MTARFCSVWIFAWLACACDVGGSSSNMPNGCTSTCGSGQVCSARAHGCVIPCTQACDPGLVCDLKSDVCVQPCGGACGSGQTCDTSAYPLGVCLTLNLPKSFGWNGMSSGVQKLSKITFDQICAIPDFANPHSQAQGWQHQPCVETLGHPCPAVGWVSEVYTEEDTVILLDPATGSIYAGDHLPDSGACDLGGGCNCTVRPESFDCTASPCAPRGVATDVTLIAGTVSANVDGFPLDLFTDQFILQVPIRQGRMTGQAVSNSGHWIGTHKGHVCGVILESDFRLALFHRLGNDALMQTTLGDALLEQEDVDANGDGKYDAWSVAISFETVPAYISGYGEKP